jgi:anti-sigma regulatory factor (Ser/Thr protein kinase)
VSGSRAIEIHLPADASAARIARRAVQALLGDAEMQQVRDALLVTSEIVTNATVHAGGATSMAATYDCAEVFHVEVTDASKARPRRVDPALTNAGRGGLGMQLLDSIASRWGVRATPVGKIVWAELTAPGQSVAVG